MTRSKIEWTDATWNPVTGCDRVSPGCDNCYAMTLAKRLKAMGNPRYQVDGDPRTSGPGFGVTLHPDKLTEPLDRKTPTTYFVNSMSDLFHPDVPDQFVAQVFAVMALAERHTFQILTKRPQRMARLLTSWGWPMAVEVAGEQIQPGSQVRSLYHGGVLPNVWFGTSVENQRYADLRIPHLLATPAAVRFLSCEPLLGPVDLSVGAVEETVGRPDRSGRAPGTGRDGRSPDEPTAVPTGIHWVIVGGESGHGARPFNLVWGLDLIEQCRAAGVPVFMKQCGSKPVTDHRTRPGHWASYAHHGMNGKGGDPEEWPAELRVRQMPEVA